MPVYELVINLGIFAVLWQLRKSNWADDRLFLVYWLILALLGIAALLGGVRKLE